MLKFLFCSLLLVNLALLALEFGYLEPVWASGHEPLRMKQQISPDKLRLLNAAAPRAAAPVAAKPEVAPVDVAKVETPPAPISCIELGDFNEAEASRFETRIAALALNARISQRRVADASSYMVYIPAQADKESADRKAAELRRLQVKDFYVISDDSALRYGISLGIFKTRSAAESHLADLVKKGVHSARVGGRGAGGGDKVAFQLHDLDAPRAASAEKLAGSFSSIVERECAQ